MARIAKHSKSGQARKSQSLSSSSEYTPPTSTSSSKNEITSKVVKKTHNKPNRILASVETVNKYLLPLQTNECNTIEQVEEVKYSKKLKKELENASNENGNETITHDESMVTNNFSQNESTGQQLEEFKPNNYPLSVPMANYEINPEITELAKQYKLGLDSSFTNWCKIGFQNIKDQNEIINQLVLIRYKYQMRFQRINEVINAYASEMSYGEEKLTKKIDQFKIMLDQMLNLSESI